MADQTGKHVLSLAADSSACPGAEALSAFCSGSLTDEGLATIAEHLSRCETCEQTVRDLTSAGDQLSSRLRAAVQQAQPIEEPALLRMQSAAKALLAVRPQSANSETALDAESAASGPLPQADGDRRTATVTEMWSPMRPAKIGRYEIQSQLGQGGFGTVYLARDPDLNRLVAIKVPKFAAGVTDERIQWFLSEARTAAGLNHPAIVAIYEIGRSSDGSCYIVMEYVEGHSLSQEMARGKLPWGQATKIIANAAAAVHYAHKKGLVHRDLKPGNILLNAEGQVKIADFGLAIHEDQQRGRAGERAGTLAYMSPEQVRGEVHRLDGRADVWSLGVIFYELLTGRRPFGGTPREMADEILNRPPKPPRQIDDAIPAHLAQICLKCLAKEPTDRFETAQDLARALAPSRSSRRKRSKVALVAAVTLVCTALLLSWHFGNNWNYQSLTSAVSGTRQEFAQIPLAPYSFGQNAELFVWHPLFTRRPFDPFPVRSKDESVQWRGDREEIVVNSPDTTILVLGTTSVKSYMLQVEISKTAPAGHSGLIFGMQPATLDGKPRLTAQCIWLVCHDAGNYAVWHDHLEITPFADGTFGLSSITLSQEKLPLRMNRPGVLEIAVSGHQLREVSWLSQPLAGPAPLPKESSIAAKCTGQFGIINRSGATIFRDAKIKLLLRDQP